MSVIEAEALEVESMTREVAASVPTPALAAESTNLPAVGNPLDMPMEAFNAGLERRGANRTALMRWVRTALVQGIDFDKIHVMPKDKCKDGKRCTNPHHFSKDTLFKPGAEKICGMMGLRVSYPTLPDYEQAAISGNTIQSIVLRCELLDASGNVVAHGIGARSLKQDYGDLNKALKMAAKSAHLDATLRCAGLSEMFTQDIEDDDSVPANAGRIPAAQPVRASGTGGRSESIGSGPVSDPHEPVAIITDEQAATLRDLLAELESTKAKRQKLETTVCGFYRVDSLEMIPESAYTQCVRKLELRRKEQAA